MKTCKNNNKSVDAKAWLRIKQGDMHMLQANGKQTKDSQFLLPNGNRGGPVDDVILMPQSQAGLPFELTSALLFLRKELLPPWGDTRLFIRGADAFSH